MKKEVECKVKKSKYKNVDIKRQNNAMTYEYYNISFRAQER